MLANPTWNCRICGLAQGEPQYGEDGRSPTFNICACCGVEFGYQDMIKEAILNFRSKWLEGDAKWSEPKLRPSNWNLEEQLKNIPQEFK